MEHTIFIGLFKDFMNHLYDFPTLQAHPLSMLVEVAPTAGHNRSEVLRQVIFDEIDHLQAPEVKAAPGALEWRPYFILHKRYVEGQPLKEVALYLSISDRQLRRDHNRALQALADLVWERLFGEASRSADKPAGDDDMLKSFELHPVPVDLKVLLEGIIDVLRRRLEAEGISLSVVIPPAPVTLFTDRIVLRQVLISLFNIAIHMRTGNQFEITVEGGPDLLLASATFDVDDGWAEDLPQDLLETARFWGKRIHTEIEEQFPEPKKAGKARLSARLPVETRGIVLVVDDQEPSLRLYQRFVSRTPYRVVGTSDPTQALDLAKRLNPVLITLDVMMPRTDGWEVLQLLQLDEQTSRIPVVICSAWEEPELARSLGAAAFLKKPVTQKDFLALIERFAS